MIVSLQVNLREPKELRKLISVEPDDDLTIDVRDWHAHLVGFFDHLLRLLLISRDIDI